MNKIIGYRTLVEKCPQKLDERVNTAMNLTGYVPFGNAYGVCVQIKEMLGFDENGGHPKQMSVCVNEYCQPMVKYE